MLTSSTEQKKSDDPILFSVGIIADVQYADADDGFNYARTRRRRFRPALQIAKNAINTWNNSDDKASQDKSNKHVPSLVISLGDVIDVLNSRTKPPQSVSAMKTVLTAFNAFKPTQSNTETLYQNISNGSKIYSDNTQDDNEQKIGDASDVEEEDQNEKKQKSETDWIPKYPIFHNLVGNHELYNFDRKELLTYMHGTQTDDGDVMFYYAFTPFPGYVLMMLDSYEISILGYKYCDDKHANYVEAQRLLNKYNPAEDKHVPVPTRGFDRRFRAFNGAFGKKQLQWLESQLKIAQQRKDNVILFSHVPVYTHLNRDYDILQWDYKEMIAVIDKYTCVKMYIAGHDHIGDLYKDKNGVFYVTFEGAVESVEDTNCFATAHFHNNKMELKGYGMISDRVFPFRPFRIKY
eukprot:1049784_1